VLTVDPDHLDDAVTQLQGLPVERFDLDALLLDRLIELTAGGKPTWELVVEADAAGPGSAPWARLRKLVDRAFDQLTDALFAGSGTAVLHHLGLVARYDRMDLIAQWRDRLHQGADPLRAVWLLVGDGELTERPMLDGREVRVLSGNEWSRVPRTWVRNVHGAAQVGGAGQ